MNRTLIGQIAWRYLRGKGTANIVPILSRISIAAIGICAGAMLIVFSVFNGFDGLVKDLYKAFYPELKITPKTGKFFKLEEEQVNKIATIKGVQYYTQVLEDKVLLSSDVQQRPAILKGVSKSYYKVNNLEQYIVEEGIGRNDESDTLAINQRYNEATIGVQLMNEMGADVHSVFGNIKAFYLNAKAKDVTINPEAAFQAVELLPTKAFEVQEEFDSKYVLTDISVANYLMQADGQYSSIELKLADDADADEVAEEIQRLIGDNYLVATRYQQNKTLYTIMASEKWTSYAILLLVLLIASFNMVGALSLLILEKQKDMSILTAMGARAGTIKSIFITEGFLWSFIGGSIGLLLGLLLCLGQQQFGWLKLQGSFIIEAYPVTIMWTDILIIIATIVAIGLLAAFLPAQRAGRIDATALRGN
ncbi:MAG: FtsX-like permease family protein [Flavipsychrobacter sp.]